MTYPVKEASVLEIPQQRLGDVLHPAWHTPELEHRLGRACMPHSLTAIDAIVGGAGRNQVQDLLDFVETYGASLEPGEGRPDYYEDAVGWKIVPMADRMRQEGKTVISQNLRRGPDATDIARAADSGRVRTGDEAAILRDRSLYGGSDRSFWMDALRATTATGGFVNASIWIPRRDQTGRVGHTVLITDVRDGMVQFFDPDSEWSFRYDLSGQPLKDVRRIDDRQLFYEQPADSFAHRMTGEVIHVYVPGYDGRATQRDYDSAVA